MLTSLMVVQQFLRDPGEGAEGHPIVQWWVFVLPEPPTGLEPASYFRHAQCKQTTPGCSQAIRIESTRPVSDSPSRVWSAYSARYGLIQRMPLPLVFYGIPQVLLKISQFWHERAKSSH